MIATKASITGNIIAETGSIGGWTIEKNKLYSGVDNRYVGLSSQSVTDNDITSQYAIWAGNEKPVNANFSVKKDGTVNITKNLNIGNNEALKIDKNGNLFINSGSININEKFQVNKNGQLIAEEAQIEGKITATTLSCNNGTIGGWTIEEDGIFSQKSDPSQPSNTILYSNGDIYSKYGRIGQIDGQTLEEQTVNFGLEALADKNSAGSIVITTLPSLSNQGSQKHIALKSGGSIFLECEGKISFAAQEGFEGLPSTVAIFG